MKNENIPIIEKSNEIITYDQTIIEILDKKWKKYLIPRKNILKVKLEINENPNNNSSELLIIEDKDNIQQKIIKEIIENNKDDNLTYHWLYVKDINNQIILVKKEHLLDLKMTNEPTMIMDYFGKKKQIYPGQVCRIAKKYHITEGKGLEKILFKLSDEYGDIHFITKPILNFAKKKRMLNDETFSIEITDKNNEMINVKLESIRDIEEFNAYSEYCEINDINGYNIIVKKMDLQDLKELYDKNLLDDSSKPQKISDYTLINKYEIYPNEEYMKTFPYKYTYEPNSGIVKDKNNIEYISVNDSSNKTKVFVRKTLIDTYLNENLNILALLEEVNDIDNKKVLINPFEIIKKIILNYDDVYSNSGPYVLIETSSKSKHLLKKSTIVKAIKELSKNDSGEYINIKDSTGVIIVTSLSKLKEINIDSSEVLLIPLEDVTGRTVYIKKKLILQIVNRMANKEQLQEFESVTDYLGEKKTINIRQINMKNSKVKKNFI